MTILPLTYLGGVEWFARLAQDDCVIDVGENWVKQTARNRAEIMTANGVAALTVPGSIPIGCRWFRPIAIPLFSTITRSGSRRYMRAGSIF